MAAAPALSGATLKRRQELANSNYVSRQDLDVIDSPPDGIAAGDKMRVLANTEAANPPR